MRPPLRLAATGKEASSASAPDTAELLELEAVYCSHGDTVHYTDPPKIFERCEGSFLYDARGPPVPRPADVVLGGQFRLRATRASTTPLQRQLDRLPQVASQYLHREKIELAAMHRPATPSRSSGCKGRVHFNVGGSAGGRGSASSSCATPSDGKSLMFAFEGGYHGRTLGASAITSSYRYRRRYGHFGDRAQFMPFPYHFRGPKGMSKEEYGDHCVQAVRAPVRERIQRRVGSEGRPGRVRRLLRRADPGHRRLRHPAEELLHRAEEGARPARHPAGRRRDPDGLLPHRQALVDRAFRRASRTCIVFGKALTNGLNPLAGIWAREELINPDSLPARLDPLDLQRQPDGHRGRRSKR